MSRRRRIEPEDDEEEDELEDFDEEEEEEEADDEEEEELTQQEQVVHAAVDADQAKEEGEEGLVESEHVADGEEAGAGVARNLVTGGDRAPVEASHNLSQAAEARGDDVDGSLEGEEEVEIEEGEGGVEDEHEGVGEVIESGQRGAADDSHDAIDGEEEALEVDGEESEEEKAIKKQRERMRLDPSFVPTLGPFFLHDDRQSSRHARGGGAEGKSSRGLLEVRGRQVDDGVERWGHDKYEELLREDEERGDDASDRRQADAPGSHWRGKQRSWRGGRGGRGPGRMEERRDDGDDEGRRKGGRGGRGSGGRGGGDTDGGGSARPDRAPRGGRQEESASGGGEGGEADGAASGGGRGRNRRYSANRRQAGGAGQDGQTRSQDGEPTAPRGGTASDVVPVADQPSAPQAVQAAGGDGHGAEEPREAASRRSLGSPRATGRQGQRKLNAGAAVFSSTSSSKPKGTQLNPIAASFSPNQPNTRRRRSNLSARATHEFKPGKGLVPISDGRTAPTTSPTTSGDRPKRYSQLRSATSPRGGEAAVEEVALE